MGSHDYQDQLNHERATNEHSIRVQQQNQTRRRELARGIITTRSADWTDTGPQTGTPIRRILPLIGRVALTSPDEDLDTDYYIGDGYLTQEEMNVDSCAISWAAPAAGVFFKGRNSAEAVPDPGLLAARRTFRTSPTDQIIDYEDQLEDEVDCADVFPLPLPSEIPPAPPTRISQTPISQAPPVMVPEDKPKIKDESEDLIDTSPAASRPVSDSPEGLRAERLVKASLEDPRTGHLPSALNTLQPDQYQFVTWPADTQLLLQGSPGTGKTVVAVYRALYLTHSEHKDRKVKRLALVGPTQAWTHHVNDLLNTMEASNVTCINLEDLIWGASQGPRHALHHSRQSWFKVDWGIYGLALRVIRRLEQEEQLDLNKKRAVKQVLETLINDTPIHRNFVNDLERSQWLLSIPSYSEARKWPDCLLLFAAVSVALEQTNRRALKPFPLSHYDHIIVDEAQDIRGVEWAILNQMITPKGTWSIIGDMNQRRADYTFDSWRELIDKLEIGDADIDVEKVLTTGYRSTRQIMKFASGLIDQPIQWTVNMLRDGPDVVVERTTTNNLPTKLMGCIDHLTSQYRQGTVAVIGINRADIEPHVLRAGWRREQTGTMYHKDRSQRLMLADPIQASGLEFDAVVVVEPADFPTNLGRNGQLYASLTRAHQELIVVHTKPLPERLRGRTRDPEERPETSTLDYEPKCLRFSEQEMSPYDNGCSEKPEERPIREEGPDRRGRSERVRFSRWRRFFGLLGLRRTGGGGTPRRR